ncbi:hypothetical protein CDL15_Pgr006384 [Punica granatum]|uniref:Uncharacterized protein n=1 Tax=Punica granatum TaxID=22663 RepID=A0A218VTX2_PUNGR|nr:hypothetical protein CDL15_Pgr006384 [Punica granatum]PKI42129.1 hypothetical protein CRG98_037471 [Punica granatum]
MESTRSNGDDASYSDESNQNSTTIGEVVAGLVMAGLAIAGGIAWAFGSSGDRKTMKAPGGTGRIYRDDFARDPKDYFRNLHKK